MSEIFCVQDRTGTAAQLVLENALPSPAEVGDTGAYIGFDYKGTVLTLDFTVGAVNDPENICITTMTPIGGPGDVTKSNWPKAGTITWLTGENVNASPDTVVLKRYPANAYIPVEFFLDYHASRGNDDFPASPVDPIRRAIVKATDYLNQRYRYKGIKLLQYLSSSALDPMLIYLDPWLIPESLGSAGVGISGQGFAPAHTSQFSEWPRQGVVDFSGDSVYGIPQVIMEACAEAAIRVVSGTDLQPDYDPDITAAGGILSSFTNKVGPIEESKTFDTKLGIGFFPDIPQIKRMLSKSGILLAGGGRTVIR